MGGHESVAQLPGGGRVTRASAKTLVPEENNAGETSTFLDLRFPIAFSVERNRCVGVK